MAGGQNRVRTRRGRDHLNRRNSQLVGAAGFLAAAFLPVVLWHRAIASVASDFRVDFHYLLTGWTGYGLIVLGLLFFVPVVISIGQDPESRWYPRARNAYVAWGASLYVLGAALASQVAQITQGYTAP